MIDCHDFIVCMVPRSKTGEPAPLELPEIVRPVLRARWEAMGKPNNGPVFPVEKGERAGLVRASRVSHAKRLRRNLLKAGIVRHKCIRPADAKPRGWNEPCCANMVHDPLYSDTATSLRVDFHSFRRAFNTGLAEAEVNVQHAMHLAGHSDAKVHMRYVMNTEKPSRVPARALPAMSAGPFVPGGDFSKARNQNLGTPGGTRTHDPRLRRPPLYPTELRALATD